MDIVQSKSNLLFKIIAILVVFPLISNIIFPIYSKAEIVNDPETDYLYINSPIVLEFDNPIEWNKGLSGVYNSNYPNSPIAYNNANSEIVLNDITTGIPVRVAIDLEIDPINQNRLIVQPNSPLDMNKEYQLKINNHFILKDGANGINNLSNQVLPSLSTALEYTFETGFLTFEDLMSGNRKINTIIQDYTPRKIKVTAPKRYVEEMEIIHKRQDLVQGSTTESVTNIDVKVNHGPSPSIIKRIEVTPKKNGVPLQAAKTIDYLNSPSISGIHVYDFGFTRLPDTSGFDFEVVIYDADDNILDKRIIKVPYEQSPTTTIKQKDRFSTANKTYSLYDLMKKPTDLQKLLNENRMNEIKVQVVQN
ncbi:Ig-like domain-containing protein [Niallia oryzisoli]|uniref:Ig-like domain-containing protein n=1 Tax=Niallia oryzisoli TaxID=1737571 RepID=A0ABZ2CE76_9BACI